MRWGRSGLLFRAVRRQGRWPEATASPWWRCAACKAAGAVHSRSPRPSAVGHPVRASTSEQCRLPRSLQQGGELLQHAPALTWEHASFHCTCRAICRAAYSKVQELRQALDTEWAAFKQANAAYHQQQVRVQ